jgi:hypothetical protein
MDVAVVPCGLLQAPWPPIKGAPPSPRAMPTAEPPPVPWMAATAKLRSRPAQVQINPSPPSLAHAQARRRAVSPAAPSHRRHSRPRRLPCLAASAAPRRPLPRPNQPPESAPWDPGTLLRPCPAGPGRRLAGIWSDRRCPDARDHFAKINFFPGSLLQKVNSNSKSDFLILVNCVENHIKIRKM